MKYYNRKIKIIGTIAGLIFVLFSTVKLLKLVYINSFKDIFFINALVGFDVFVTILFGVLLLINRDEKYEEFNKSKASISINKVMNNDFLVSRVIGGSNFLIAIIVATVEGIDLVRQYSRGYYTFSTIMVIKVTLITFVIILNLLQVIGVRVKETKVIATIAPFLTFVLLGAFYEIGYLVIGTICWIGYLFMIKVISKASKYEDIESRIIISVILGLIGYTIVQVTL